jgi:hypothetical protein
VHSQAGAVGAADLLLASKGEVLLADMAADVSALEAQVSAMLGDEQRLRDVARSAVARARSW